MLIVLKINLLIISKLSHNLLIILNSQNTVSAEGKLKGLGVQAMYIDVNFANPAKPDLQEYRVATTYTHKF